MKKIISPDSRLAITLLGIMIVFLFALFSLVTK